MGHAQLDTTQIDVASTTALIKDSCQWALSRKLVVQRNSAKVALSSDVVGIQQVVSSVRKVDLLALTSSGNLSHMRHFPAYRVSLALLRPKLKLQEEQFLIEFNRVGCVIIRQHGVAIDIQHSLHHREQSSETKQGILQGAS
jgi:hypothetical protein